MSQKRTHNEIGIVCFTTYKSHKMGSRSRPKIDERLSSQKRKAQLLRRSSRISPRWCPATGRNSSDLARCARTLQVEASKKKREASFRLSIKPFIKRWEKEQKRNRRGVAHLRSARTFQVASKQTRRKEGEEGREGQNRAEQKCTEGAKQLPTFYKKSPNGHTHSMNMSPETIPNQRNEA